jgi:regulator of protease activity HflC (stomatin/prohibitin superfamily)
MKFNVQQFKPWLRKSLTSLLIPFLLTLFVLAYLSHLIIYNVLPGQAGIIWRRFMGGTVTDTIYGEGIHFILPWDIMYIYNVRVQQRSHEFDVLTTNGLTLHLAISIRYYPEREMLGILHQKVGPDYVETVVIPEIESVLRVLIGTKRAEDVYNTNEPIIENAVNDAVEQIAQRFINVDDVIIKRIEFPQMIAQAIEQKMEQQQLDEAYAFKLSREKKEAERKLIEAEGIRNQNKTVAESLSPNLLLWKWIQALETSPNSKLIVTGSQGFGLPLIGNIPLDTSFGAMTSLPPAATIPQTLVSEATPVPDAPTPDMPSEAPPDTPDAADLPAAATPPMPASETTPETPVPVAGTPQS